MRGMRSSRTGPSLLALVVLAAAPLLVACGADDPRDDAPVLEVAWTSVAEGWDAYRTPSVADEDIWVYRSHESRALVGVSLDDGAVAWTSPLGEVCAFSAIDDAGSLAVQSGPRCSTLTVLDVTSGETRWTDTVRFPDDTYPSKRGLSLGISAETVTVATRCGIERWALADGAFRSRLQARGENEYCRPSATSGDLAIVADRTGLIGYDSETGALRWRRPGATAAVHRIHAVDPLLADVAIDGVRAVRRIDPATGELGPVVGRPLPVHGPGVAIADPVGDAVIGAYHDPAGGFDESYAAVVRAWDGASGEQRWARPSTGDDYLGADADGFYLGRPITDRDDGDGYAYWVMRWGPDDAEPQTVGWIDEQVLDMKRVGDLLLVGGSYGQPTTAYRLPGTSEDLPIPDGRDEHTDPTWSRDDLRTDPLVDPCAAVTPQTLRDLGFVEAAALPAPLDCRWSEGDRVLVVGVSVERPDDDRTAVEVAEQRATDLRNGVRYDEVEDSPLAEEVWQASTASVGASSYEEVPGATSTGARVLVREANVVVGASFEQAPGDPAAPARRLPIAGARVQEGLRAAVRDVLSTWDRSDAGAGPGSGQDGTITAVPDPCRTLARGVRPLVPRARPVDLTAAGEERLLGCRWQPRQYGDLVQVTAYAVGPNPLTGATATAEASSIVAADGGVPLAEPVRGPWDEAWQSGERRSPFRDAGRLVVRVDNLVLVVQVALSDLDEGRRGAGARATSVRLARTYLAEVRTAAGQVPATP